MIPTNHYTWNINYTIFYVESIELEIYLNS